MEPQGLLHLYIGTGKGKTTAAVGLSLRMAGNGGHVLFGQFLKAAPTGEVVAFLRYSDLVEVVRPQMRHRAFLWNQTPQQRVETLEDLRAAWLSLAVRLQDECISLFVFDELLDVIELGAVTEEEVLAALAVRHRTAEVVLTGRRAPEGIVAAAGYITSMEAVRHPYESGTQARRGIEF